ncbi:sporulation integral membrane protein YtvI [Paenibacillus baekrokdamisoli]|uniref:Sporulation integral membrane protein YtvI n=1 Tax=Paenibacillus baekrokdamisoli TaxID=1712516 RepID=A0A3G9J978_9BACL|nr:AI-2E family transporter [Paenibacillus baekrokdamisoli]MBB3071016.1 sporulation integral membrane protein YtvI [Paenibacillus baekrokdamisoli]BBH21433.1 sporulation integral membrane protein YtvI [Paenibacillus baekrokdamisoli]
MLSFYRKYWRTAFDIALIALTVYLIMFTFSYLYRIATPIFLSFIIFMFIEPPAKWLNRLGLKKSIAAGISVLIFTLVIVGAFVGVGFIMTSQITGLAGKLPYYQHLFTEQFQKNSTMIHDKYYALPPSVLAKLNDVIGYITDWGQKLAASFLLSLGGYLKSFSTFIFNFSIGIILAYFLSLEITDWKQTAANKTPKTFKKAFFFLRDNVFSGIGAYLKAQGKLISITFGVIFISLLLLGVENAFSISLLSAVFDVLPLLGVGTVFVPWIIYLFIVGKAGLAIWLSVLFLAVVLTRQILEPKITGDTLGVSAFTMLAFMIVSLSIFGIAGVILSPILMILIKALYDQRYFQRWIHSPKGEFEQQAEPPAEPLP